MQKTFDIFSGTFEENPSWVATVGGLSNTRERMEQIARENPGRYFIFCPIDRTVLAAVETFKIKPTESRHPPLSAESVLKKVEIFLLHCGELRHAAEIMRASNRVIMQRTRRTCLNVE
jgi:hypothetical protein